MQSMIPRGGGREYRSRMTAPFSHMQACVVTQWIQPTFAGPDVADVASPFLIGAMVGSLGEPAKHGSLAM